MDSDDDAPPLPPVPPPSVTSQLPVGPVPPPSAPPKKKRRRKKVVARSWDESGAKFDRGRFGKRDVELVLKAVQQYVADVVGKMEPPSAEVEADRKRCMGRLWDDSEEGDRDAWLEIAAESTLAKRTVSSIYDIAERRLHSTLNSGRWSDEALAELAELVSEYGLQWPLIGRELQRLPSACRDRWRSQSKMPVGAMQRAGEWDDAERDQLRAEMRRRHGDVIPKTGMSWPVVAKAVSTRSWEQCRMEWSTSLDPKIRLPWTLADDRALIDTIAASSLTKEKDLDWKAIRPERLQSDAQLRWQQLTKPFVTYHARGKLRQGATRPTTQQVAKALQQKMPPLDR